MRIGFVIPYFYPALEYGGTPRVAYEFARCLVRRGHKVTVLTTDSGGKKRLKRQRADATRGEHLEGIEVFYYPNLSNYLAYKKRLFFPPHLFQDIRRDLSSSEVVHIHEFRSLLTVAAHFALRKLNIPYVLSPHGGLQRLGKERLKALFDRLWGNRILEDAAALCAVSNLEIRDARQFGVGEEKIYLLPNPIDEHCYKSLPERGKFIRKWNLGNKRVVLFLGRLHWIKGIDVLIDSITLLDDIPDLHLVIAGPDDGAEEALRVRAANKKITHGVTFTGFLNDFEKLEALVDSEIVVIPSRREGFPGTALEALAAAKPVVLSSMCGTNSWIPDHAMTVFESGNAQDLAQKMRRRLLAGSNPQDLLDARNLVLRNFSTSTLTAKAEALYQSVLPSPSGRG
jgi:glycosyltransferase involved in cell wall biosynthesis